MGKTKISVVGDRSSEALASAGRQNVKRKTEKKKSLKKEKGVRVPGLKGGERVVAVGFETPTETTETNKETEKGKKGKVKREKHRGKRYLAARTKVDPGKNYTPEEAARLVKETSISRFNGSVELHLVLTRAGINTQVELPYSTGKTKKIEIANEETIEKLKGGKIDFDLLLAAPDMMPKLIPFAKLLGPRGLLPNPKQGTLINDPEKAKEKFGGKNLQIKTEKNAPLAHLVVAKTIQPEDEIAKNIRAIMEAVGSRNIQKAVVSASMGPGIKVSVG